MLPKGHNHQSESGFLRWGDHGVDISTNVKVSDDNATHGVITTANQQPPVFLRKMDGDFYGVRCYEDDDCDGMDDDSLNRTLHFPQDKLFGREEELRRLEDIFARVISADDSSSTSGIAGSTHSQPPNLQFVILEGFSGSGKTALVSEFLKRIKTKHSTHKRSIVFASGKYDAGHSSKPTTSATSLAGRVGNILDNDEGGDANSPIDTSGMLDTSSVPFSGIAQALTMLAVEQLSSSNEEFCGGGTSMLSSTILESNEDVGSGFWIDSLRPDDIRLLVEIAPGLAPFLSLPFVRRPSTIRQDEGDSIEPTRSTFEKEPGLDDSNRTLVTSNLQKSFSTDSSGCPAWPSVHVDTPHIAMVVGTFLRMILKPKADGTHDIRKTLVFFLDDLQWMDTGSLALLEYLWKDPSLPFWMFIGAVRTASDAATITRQKQLNSFLLNLDPKKEHCHWIVVRNLSPFQVLRFVAETLDKLEPEDPGREEEELVELEPLADFLYSRTLGNAFYCRQVMEALFRRNIVYYDVVWFEWQFNLLALSSESLGGSHDDPLILDQNDVIQMVQDQLMHLPSSMLRNAIIVASYIRHSIDLQVLCRCLKAVVSKTNIWSSEDTALEIDESQILQLLEMGVEQGLLLKNDEIPKEKSFKFAHDRVQEAAYSMIVPGNNRNNIRGCVGVNLLEMARESTTASSNVKDGAFTRPEKEWMLFAAVDHLNSLPLDDIPCEMMDFLKANYHVGTLCCQKASFEQAVHHFRAVAQYVKFRGSVDEFGEDMLSLWTHDYPFCLAVHNRLLETEFTLGNFDEATTAINAVLAHAKCFRDMTDAHFTRIEMLVKQNNSDHGIGAEEGVQLLRSIGLEIPVNPTKSDLRKERLQYQMTLGTKPISSIATLQLREDNGLMKLLSQLVFLSNVSGKSALGQFACFRALRLSLEHGVSKYLLIILTDFSSPMRREGKFQEAYSYASVVQKLYERFPNENGSAYATSRLILHSGMLHLKQPFADSIDAFLANFRIALAAGNVEIALGSAMHYPLIYFASGLPLNALLEPKLILFQGKAQQLARPGYVAIFQLCRQFVRSLQGKPTTGEFLSKMSNGSMMTEDKIVKGLNGHSLKMTLRDSAILRLFLSFILDDESTMLAMMERLDEYPLFDLPLVRQHLRLTFHGLAALTLGRKLHDQMLTSKGRAMMKELRKLDSIGSLNARPAYLCLRAIEKQRQSIFDEAVEACSMARLGHLEAIMNEHCGIMLLQQASSMSDPRQGKVDSMVCLAHEYIESALWLYNEWGADAKVTQLRARYDFLTPSSFDGSVAGKSSITSFVSQGGPCSGRFDVIFKDPENVAPKGNFRTQRWSRGPHVTPRRDHRAPTMPTRSASPSRIPDEDDFDEDW